MKIRMRTTAAGPNGKYEAEKVYDVSRELATEWIAAGYAEEVKSGSEVATVASSETTTRSRGARRGKAAG